VTTRPGATLQKDPDEILVYEFDWTDAVQEMSAVATISSSTWAFEVDPDGALTKDQDAIVTGSLKTRIRLSAGTVGKLYRLANKIVTNESPAQTLERSIWIQVKDR
jgi:hypothetical protein